MSDAKESPMEEAEPISQTKEAGTWAVPNTVQKVQKLEEILSRVNGAALTQALYDVWGDDELHDALEFEGSRDPGDGSLQKYTNEALAIGLEKLLAHQQDHPEDFSVKFEPGALEMLQQLLAKLKGEATASMEAVASQGPCADCDDTFKDHGSKNGGSCSLCSCPSYVSEAAYAKTAGLSTQIRNLKKRLKNLDTSKGDAREVKDIVDALETLENRLEKETETKRKKKEDAAALEAAKPEVKEAVAEDPQPLSTVPPVVAEFTRSQWIEKANVGFGSKELFREKNQSFEIIGSFDADGQILCQVAPTDSPILAKTFRLQADLDLHYVDESNSFVGVEGEDLAWSHVADLCVEAYASSGPSKVASPAPELSTEAQLSLLF